MKKSKLLLGLGTMTIAAMPVLAVVSCSNESSSSFGVSSETQKIYESVFDKNNQDVHGVYENKVQTSIKNVQPTQTKTEAEVLEIAKQKIQNMTNEELRKWILNSCIKGARNNFFKEESRQSSMSFLIDIDNVKFNKEEDKNEISFDYVLSSYVLGEINNKKMNIKSKQIINVSGLKIKPDVFKYNDKIFPIISYETNQPNVVMTVLSSEAKATYDNDYIVEVWKSNGQEGTFEEFKKDFVNSMSKNEKIFNSIKSSLGNKLGVVDGKFTFTLGNWTEYDGQAFSNPIFNGDSLGYYINEETGQITSQEVMFDSPIFFSTLNEDGSATWEVYSISQ